MNQAFETLFKRHKRKLSAAVQRYTRVLREAKDIVQQSSMEGFVNFCQFQGQSSFTAWLTSFAISEALSFLRRVHRPPIFYARKKLRKNLRAHAKHNPMSATHGSCAQC